MATYIDTATYNELIIRLCEIRPGFLQDPATQVQEALGLIGDIWPESIKDDAQE
jgi:hypothetical protein